MFTNVPCSFNVLLTDYPWRVAAQPMTSNVIKWFYLPDFAKRPNPTFIFCETKTWRQANTLFSYQTLTISRWHSADDHLLLLCSSLQWQVFEEENRAAVRLLAGDNVEISRSLDPCSFNQFIPVNNFLHCRSQKPQALIATRFRRDKYSKQISWNAKFKYSWTVSLWTFCSGSLLFLFLRVNLCTSFWSSGATWIWSKCLCSVISSGLCCVSSSSPEPPGLASSAWATWWPVSTSCCLEVVC